MATYEYGRIEKLSSALTNAGIDQTTIDAIMAGGESIGKNAKPEKKADWFREAMVRMDNLLDESTKRSIREACACCLSGKRLEISKKIGKSNNNLEDAIKAANDAKFVFGHSVTLEVDGRVVVCFQPEGKESYRCVCMPKSKEPISATYCYCCGGHIKHHLQIALNKKLSCEVRSSALASGGKSPCSFSYAIED